MQIILLEKVVNLGNLGEVVKVKDGYARNFLIPSGQARRATDMAIKEFEVRRAELEKAAHEKLLAAQSQGEKLNGTSHNRTNTESGGVTLAEYWQSLGLDDITCPLGRLTIEELLVPLFIDELTSDKPASTTHRHN